MKSLYYLHCSAVATLKKCLDIDVCGMFKIFFMFSVNTSGSIDFDLLMKIFKIDILYD